MNKLRSYFLVFLIINIFLINIFNIFHYRIYAVAEGQVLSDDIDNIDDIKYPKIKSMIKDLQAKYPNWNFRVLYTNLKWDEVIQSEHNHGTNLVPANSIYYDRDWICSECGAKPYDSGNWYCASKSAIEYMMDPRNSLNEDDLFQFLQLSYLECTYQELKSMVVNYDYLNKEALINEVIRIGSEKNVNPFFIMAKIIQEQGNGTSVLATGAKYIGVDGEEYEGYYNLLNIKASGNGKEQVITNGLKYAKSKEWDTPEKSIEGGISTVIVKYIQYGQDTMYFQKFDVSSTRSKHYIYQYMQNVLGAQSEGTILRKNLQKNGIYSEKYAFIIPLYEEMPQDACPVPLSTYRSSRASDETRDTINDVIQNDDISNNKNEEDIMTQNEETNIIENETTSINEEVIGNENEVKVIVENKNIKIMEDTKMFFTIPGIDVKEIMDSTNVVEIKNANDEVIAQTDTIGTGYKIGEYTIVVMGDVNGDADVDIIDLALLKRHISQKQLLSDVYLEAGNINQDEEEIDIIDLALLKRQINGKQKIQF